MAQPENPALRSGSISKPDAHDFGRRVAASTSGLFGDPSRASAPGPHATPGRDVRDGPNLFGGCPGIDSGPRRLRAAVSRSTFWSLMARCGVSTLRGPPLAGMPLSNPQETVIRPSSERRASLGRMWQRSSALLRKIVRYPLRSPVSMANGSLLVYDFRVLTLQEIGTEPRLTPRSRLDIPASPGTLRSNGRAS